MSLIPAFEIGVWNAWIPTTLLFMFIMLSGLLPKDIGKRITPTKEEGRNRRVMLIVFFIMIIYSIFLPLRLGTIWFYAGLIFYIVGMTLGFLAIYGFATTPVDKPVSKGIFRISRNPMYLGGFIFFIGIGLVSVSLIYIIMTLAWLILLNVLDIPIEESECISKYGNDYRNYMKKTPKWLGIPKLS